MITPAEKISTPLRAPRGSRLACPSAGHRPRCSPSSALRRLPRADTPSPTAPPGGNGPRVARDVAFQPGQVLAEYRRTTFQHGQRLLGKKPKYEGKGSGEPRKFVVRSREHVDQPFPPYPQSLFSDLVNRRVIGSNPSLCFRRHKQRARPRSPGSHTV